MLDVKRVLKAAPTKMRSQEPLQQLWTPWGEQIAGEWLSSNDAHKAFCPAKDGERKLENGRTPILNEHPRPTMVQSHHAQRILGLRDRVHSRKRQRLEMAQIRGCAHP